MILNLANTVLLKGTMMKYIIVQAIRKTRVRTKARGVTLTMNKLKL